MDLIPSSFESLDPSITLVNETDFGMITMGAYDPTPTLKQRTLFIYHQYKYEKTRPLCHYTECITTDNKVCQFPFRYLYILKPHTKDFSQSK